MEEEINYLLNESSITNIILKYDQIKEKINKLEHDIINLTTNINKDKIDQDKLEKLKLTLDRITDSYIKDATIEDLISMYKKVSKLCINN